MKWALQAPPPHQSTSPDSPVKSSARATLPPATPDLKAAPEPTEPPETLVLPATTAAQGTTEAPDPRDRKDDPGRPEDEETMGLLEAPSPDLRLPPADLAKLDAQGLKVPPADPETQDDPETREDRGNPETQGPRDSPDDQGMLDDLARTDSPVVEEAAITAHPPVSLPDTKHQLPIRDFFIPHLTLFTFLASHPPRLL